MSIPKSAFGESREVLVEKERESEGERVEGGILRGAVKGVL